MRRRELLVALGGVSGCAGYAPPLTDTPGVGCPSPSRSSDATTYCTESGSASPIRMTATPARLSTPLDTCRCALINESDYGLRSSASAWELYGYLGGTWYPLLVKSRGSAHRPVELEPGGSREWLIQLNIAELGPYAAPETTDTRRSFTLRFPPGIYAFGYGVSLPNTDERRTYVSQFVVSGERPPLVPSENVVTHRRDGHTLVVETRLNATDEDFREVSLVLEQTHPSEESISLGLIELYNPLLYPGLSGPHVRAFHTALLRDGLALAEPSDESVRVQTTDTTRPPLSMDDNEAFIVDYGGTFWRVTSENGWR